VFFPLAGQ